MESFISGSSSSTTRRPIHVYLSFKGDEETCKVTDMLWASLEYDDLNTFWDDKKLDTADSIIPRHFLKAIQQSNISIVVFSKNYASSIWCLEELSGIAARIHEPRYSVYPIFYDVLPSEVQNLTNSFQIAFAAHEQRFKSNIRKVQRWRLAMKQVANLSVWHVRHVKASLKVEAMVLELEESQERTLKVKGLSLMRNLRLLIFRNVEFSGVLKYLPLQLRYILWHQYPFACLPSSFVPHNPDSSITNIWEGDGELPDNCIMRRVERGMLMLCVSTELNLTFQTKLHLEPHLLLISFEAQSQFIISRRERDQQTPDSCMTNIWEGDMTFPLKNMNLNGSKNLIKMSNFKIFPNLERLDLEGCTKLSLLDASIASLSKLKFLNLRNCINLTTIPNNLFPLPSLEVLNLACCSKFAYCLKFCRLEELGETEIIEQSFYRKRQKLCRQNSI